jgi:hypothetical protein
MPDSGGHRAGAAFAEGNLVDNGCSSGTTAPNSVKSLKMYFRRRRLQEALPGQQLRPTPQKVRGNCAYASKVHGKIQGFELAFSGVCATIARRLDGQGSMRRLGTSAGDER